MADAADTTGTGAPHGLATLVERSWQVSCGLGRMSPLERFASLVEEVGELGEALLVRKGVKPLNEGSEDIEIAFAGVLFDLLVLACEEDVDLETGMQRGIAMLEQRLERPAAGW